MSECPNCGSAAIAFRYGKARWICGSHGHGADYFPHQTTVCQLIRSLREELARERDKSHAIHVQYVKALLIKHRIEKQLTEAVERVASYQAAARDAERDRIADWLSDKSLATDAMTLKGGDTQANARLRAIAWQQAKGAVQIRNNEHRSDT